MKTQVEAAINWCRLLKRIGIIGFIAFLTIGGLQLLSKMLEWPVFYNWLAH